LDDAGKVLIVEVEPDHRRNRIAIALLAQLRAAGYVVQCVES
jgi:hypothetical protein